MNMGFHSALNFISRFNSLINKKQDMENFIFFPPAGLFGLFQKENLYWGGQNVYHKSEGALTGENSAKTLKEMGASFCLLGHSERRYIFGESDADIEQKFNLLQELGLIPVLCIGEHLTDRSCKEKILKRQLSWIKNYKRYQNLPYHPELLPPTFKNSPLIVAYEPVWSIGTGEIPAKEEINETAQFIKEYLSLASLTVFYGGSIDKHNVKNFKDCSFVDGFLIGGASLDPDHFYNIYQQIHHSG